jgi:hypothetical protein
LHSGREAQKMSDNGWLTDCQPIAKIIQTPNSKHGYTDDETHSGFSFLIIFITDYCQVDRLHGLMDTAMIQLLHAALSTTIA